MHSSIKNDVQSCFTSNYFHNFAAQRVNSTLKQEPIMFALQQGCTLQDGKYKIIKMLGQGSFGITYLATTKLTMMGKLGQVETTVNVAIKEFFMSEMNSRDNDGCSIEGSGGSLFINYRRKFRKEAENLSRLDHPNIVKVLEVFDENNTTYYVMQYIDGESLDDYIHRCNGIQEIKAISIFKDIASAIQYMHSHKMLHLDLKPKNIMLDKTGKSYLIDFGLSKQYTDNGEPESSTTIGAGTPGYAPIEQVNYKQDGSFPTTLDIYALGATFFKMLSGIKPQHASEVLEEGLNIVALTKKGVSRSTIDAVQIAMAPIKKNRYQTVQDFLAAVITSGQSESPKFKTKQKQNYTANTEDTEIGEETIIPDTNRSKKIIQRKSLNMWWGAIVLPVLVAILYFIFSRPNVDLRKAFTVDDRTNPEVIDTLEHNMVFVKGGTFIMGAETGLEWTQKHKVTLSDFYIGKTEVTQSQWKAVMGNNPSVFKGNDLPVENVKWADVLLFIQKLNAITGKNYRLPTESEWEFAAKGGNNGKGFKYSGSNDYMDVAWCKQNSKSSTHAVGTKLPNELGLYDMSGNVNEWCSDWYSEYPKEDQIDPQGGEKDPLGRHIIRGGGWDVVGGKGYGLEITDRTDGGDNQKHHNALGFRLARNAH